MDKQALFCAMMKLGSIPHLPGWMSSGIAARFGEKQDLREITVGELLDLINEAVKVADRKVLEMAAAEYLALGAKYRKKTGRHDGIVIIFEGEAIGWMDELRDPHGCSPGCIAVDTQGHIWTATGWNPGWNGASRWGIFNAKEVA